MSEIKSKPTPGFRYIVRRGDFINLIAGAAYGDRLKWPIISKANQRIVKGPDAGTGGDQQWFFPGDIIFIPELQSLKKKKIKEKLPNKQPNESTLIIAGREINLRTSRLTRAMDTGADGVVCTIAWTPGLDAELDKVTSPYGYQPSQFYIGGELQLSGYLYNVKHSSTKDGRSKELSVFSDTVDLVDSTVRPPFEFNNQTLKQIAQTLCLPFGIDVIVDDGVDIGGKFKRVTADKTETVFAFLSKLASQRGCLVTSTKFGDLLITVADLKSPPIGTIAEGQPQSQSFEIEFNGRDRFNMIKAISQSPGKTGGTAIAVDDVVPRPRFTTFQATDALSGELKKAAEWKRNKILADALTIPFPVDSWRDTRGNLWDWNKKISIVSPTIGTEKGFTFLIRRVEIINEVEGKTAVISIVPPEVYSREKIQEPWLK